MKKRASLSISTMLVMCVMVIWFDAHLSIAQVFEWESNGTTSWCDGSVEECLINLNIHHLDSQLPTISTSHLSRILADKTDKYSSLRTQNGDNPAFCSTNTGYIDCLANYKRSSKRCEEIYKRDCHFV
ncbi:hypothetical protein Fmac_017412 [Flemingia macrophylla]|uniref:Uncharacterized protein n=1 Tax=Flemingia macrophylla TaxID=520843 RepID=A0ABD1M209_9FABA